LIIPTYKITFTLMLKYFLSLFALSVCTCHVFAQNNSAQALTTESLWKLGRVSGIGLSNEGMLTYNVSTPNVAENKSSSKQYLMPLQGSEPVVYILENKFSNYENAKLSPDGKRIAFSKEVALENIIGKDKYSDLPKSNAYIFTDLNNRHWDTWEDGSYSHVFVADVINGAVKNERDIMLNEKYDCPQKPFGGAEDFVWSADSKNLVYVCKKKYGKEYAQSTNTDLYAFNADNNSTTNLTEGMMGYDNSPIFSADGKNIAWLSMKRDGFEADKVDIVIMDWLTKTRKNITAQWDETVDAFAWSNDNSKIYFVAPWKGTKQLFKIPVAVAVVNTGRTKKQKPNMVGNVVTQITNGQWDVNEIIGEWQNTMAVTRSDMNHANEIYAVDLNNGNMRQVSHVNDKAYSKIKMCTVKGRTTKATDGGDLFSWVVYPPDFDANKKYPTLLYCQGGPQGSISQFYSFRWNFQLMASQGYIVVVPNRRGCQGWGTKWNEDISKEWGGQAIQDYLAAFDDVAKETYVDKNKTGAVGASYGGYSVFMLAGIHQNRFKTFIAHDGLFDLRSWYGTTEELWFANWDIGGNYWSNPAPKSYNAYNPSNFVAQWNTPIMIVQGGKDYRVGIEQGLQAFQAAQLKGIKSKLLYLPEENHWVLKAQNAQVWQREFFGWLKETM
jgi:dipeptidyl aminopeptidase/acylaminoacyl peptidase